MDKPITSYLEQKWTLESVPSAIAELQLRATDLVDSVRANEAKIEQIKLRKTHKEALVAMGTTKSHKDVEEAKAIQADTKALNRKIQECQIVIEFLNRQFQILMK